MACQPASVKFQLRRATSSNWTVVNPILKAGEPGFESDSYKLKIGDGVNTWATLPYLSKAQGPTGSQGIQGVTGTQGPTGSQGIQGVTGTFVNPTVTYVDPTSTTATSYTIDLTGVTAGTRYYARSDGSLTRLIFSTPTSPTLPVNFHVYFKNSSSHDITVYHYPGGVGTPNTANEINNGTTTLEKSVAHRSQNSNNTAFLYVYWTGTN
jgi:hypothetical protein